MIRKTTIILVLFSLGGCMSKGMSNDEIIKEVKKCEDAHLRVTVIWPDLKSTPEFIVCVPLLRPEDK